MPRLARSAFTSARKSVWIVLVWAEVDASTVRAVIEKRAIIIAEDRAFWAPFMVLGYGLDER